MRLNFVNWRGRGAAKNPILLIVGVSLGALAGEELLFFARRNAAPTFYWNEFFGWDRPMAWITALTMASAIFLASLTRNLDASGWAQWMAKRIHWIIGASLGVYLALTAYISSGFAYTPDEFCALLQAQTFALGKITPQVAPELVDWIIPKSLQNDLIYISTTTGRYSPLYWPGFGFLLAPFAFFGAEWLCNPLLTALTLWLWFQIASRLTGQREAGVWAIIFGLVAATIVLNAVTFFAMPAHLLANLLFCWLFMADKRAAFFGAGLVGGFALILHNPLPHFSFALPWLFWAFRHRRAQFPWLILGYLVIAPVVGIGWSLHLGEFRQGNVASTPNFGEVVARIAYAFQPPDAALLQVRLAALVKLLLWAAPGGVVLACLGWREAAAQKAATPSEAAPRNWNAHYLWLLGASVVSNFVVYLFVRYDEGHAWGFRYLHHTWGALPILAAAFVVSHRQRYPVGLFAPRPWLSPARFAAILCFLGLVVVLPLRLAQMRKFLQTVQAERPAPTISSAASIVFILENRTDASADIRNDPFLRSPHWRVRHRGRSNNALLAQRWLLGARRAQSAPWGELWVGDGFRRAASPVTFPAR